MEKKKHTFYVIDRDNTFLKDCFHEYLETVKCFDDHFSREQLARFRKIKRRKQKEKSDQLGKPHKY